MYDVYGDKILKCKKRQKCATNQNGKFRENINFYAHKTQSST